MKNKLLFFLTAVCLVLSFFFWPARQEEPFSSAALEKAAEETRADTEMLAPNAHLTDEKGRDVTLQTLYNQKPLCLFFWAAWSKDSRQELAYLHELFATYGQDIDFVTVSLGTQAAENQAYCQEKGYALPCYTAPIAIARDYDVSSVPRVIFIKRGGQVKRAYDQVLSRRQLQIELAGLK